MRNSFSKWLEAKKTEEPEAGYWGYHLILDMSGVNDNIKDEKVIRKFLKDLVERIDMIAVGKPMIKYLLKGQPNAGFSALQLIETSSITCHFVEPNRTVYCDIFSCKKFKPADAIAVVEEYFEPKRLKKKFLTRDALKHTSDV